MQLIDATGRMTSRHGRLCAGALLAGAFMLTSVATRAQPPARETFDCIIDPALRLKLGSPVASTLRSVEVERGDRVQKGQVVARLESGIEEANVRLDQARASSTAQIASEQAKVEFADAELTRAKSLVDRAVVSVQKMQELTSAYRVARQNLVQAIQNKNTAELELERSKAMLDQRVIRSPVDGIVVQRVLGPGEYVYQDGHIMVVAQMTPLRVEAFIPVRLYGRIQPGDVATVVPDSPIGGEYQARTSVVDQVLDTASGTFGVRLDLPNADLSLPAGMRCRVTFSVAAEAAGRPASQAIR